MTLPPLPLPLRGQSPEVQIQWDLTASMVDAYNMKIKGYSGDARSGWAAARGWTEWVPAEALMGHAVPNEASADGFPLVGAIDFEDQISAGSKGTFLPSEIGKVPELRDVERGKVDAVWLRPRLPGDVSPLPENKVSFIGANAQVGPIFSALSVEDGFAVVYVSSNGMVVTLDAEQQRSAADGWWTGYKFAPPTDDVHPEVNVEMTRPVHLRSYFMHEEQGDQEMILLADMNSRVRFATLCPAVCCPLPPPHPTPTQPNPTPATCARAAAPPQPASVYPIASRPPALRPTRRSPALTRALILTPPRPTTTTTHRSRCVWTIWARAPWRRRLSLRASSRARARLCSSSRRRASTSMRATTS